MGKTIFKRVLDDVQNSGVGIMSGTGSSVDVVALDDRRCQ